MRYCCEGSDVHGSPYKYGVASAGAAFVTMLVSGCSSMDDARGVQLVDPATYLYYTCPQLATARTEQTKRRLELEGLMAKAERDAGGQIASTIAYRGDYQATLGRLQLIAASWRDRTARRRWRQRAAARFLKIWIESLFLLTSATFLPTYIYDIPFISRRSLLARHSDPPFEFIIRDPTLRCVELMQAVCAALGLTGGSSFAGTDFNQSSRGLVRISGTRGVGHDDHIQLSGG